MSLTEISRLTIENAVKRAVVTLWAALDSGDFEAVAASFSNDGVWHRQGKQLAGPSGVRTAMAERPKSARTRHLITNTLISIVDENSAEMQFYLTVYQHTADPADAPPPAPMSVPLTVALAHASMRKEAAGWKIRELKSADTFRRK
jgi:ketosteroid isomerase-like protein